MPSTIPSWPGAGLAQRHPDPPRRGRRGEQRGRRRVVDARDRHRAAQRPRLGGRVGGHRAVPVEMVLGDVEHAPGGGHHGRRPVQLEARQLHREHPPPRPDRVHHRVADVAAGHGVQPGRAAGSPRACRWWWSCRSCRSPPARRGRMPARRPDPPRQLRLADHRHPGRRRGGDERMVRAAARSGDDEPGRRPAGPPPHPPTAPSGRSASAAGFASTTVTRAPSSTSAAAAASPEIPAPATSTGASTSSASFTRRCPSRASPARRCPTTPSATRCRTAPAPAPRTWRRAARTG